MDISIVILLKLALSFTVITLGYIASTVLKVEKDSIAKLLLYLFVPLLFFSSVVKLEVSKMNILLPLLVALASSTSCLIILKCKFLYPDNNTRRFLAFASPNANVGYFLLPITTYLFNQEVLGYFILIITGNIIYENTLGFYVAAKGNFTARESLTKLLRLPAIYALFAAMIVSILNFKIPVIFDDLFLQIRGAYSLFGMMIVGMALAEISGTKLDFRYIGTAFIGKFIIQPTVTFILISLDKNFFQLLNPQTYQLLMLASMAPLAANNIVFCTVLKSSQPKAASAILLTTFFAAAYIPWVIKFIL
jgi:predicted permease